MPLIDPRLETEELRKELINLLNTKKSVGVRTAPLVDRMFSRKYEAPEGSVYAAADDPAGQVLADLTAGKEAEVMATHGVTEKDTAGVPEDLGAQQKAAARSKKPDAEARWVPWPSRRSRILYSILMKQGLAERDLLGVGGAFIRQEDVLAGGTPVVDDVSYGDGDAVGGESTLAASLPTVQPGEVGALLLGEADPSVHDNMGGTFAWWDASEGTETLGAERVMVTNYEGSTQAQGEVQGSVVEQLASKAMLEKQQAEADALVEQLADEVDLESMSPEAREVY